MSIETTAIKPLLEKEPFTDEQKHYLDGFFAGIKERAVVFADLFPQGIPGGAEETPASEPEDLTAEERIKR